jgi:biopolymer transport protein ExbD
MSVIMRTKAPPPVADINVTPMVDVMLVLLIIFMVITPMLSKGVSVDLVKTQNPVPMQAADKSDAIVVAVTRDGKTYLNTTQMKPDELPGKVKDMLTNRLDKMCFVKADSRARFEKVVDVVNNLRAAGVDQLGLLTEQAQQKKGAATATTTVGGQ